MRLKVRVTIMIDREYDAMPKIFIMGSDADEHARDIADWCMNQDENCEDQNPHQTAWNFLRDNTHWIMLHEDKEVYFG